jgi:hypothetical protein
LIPFDVFESFRKKAMPSKRADSIAGRDQATTEVDAQEPPAAEHDTRGPTSSHVAAQYAADVKHAAYCIPITRRVRASGNAGMAASAAPFLFSSRRTTSNTSSRFKTRLENGIEMRHQTEVVPLNLMRVIVVGEGEA